jgi:hypothetical protein
MTLTHETTVTAVKDPRELVSTDLFQLLVADIRRHQPLTQRYAERMMGQALVFLQAYGTMLRESRVDPSRWTRLVPSVPVDPAWHAFILRSEPYHSFCMEVAGCYMHHVPVTDEDIRSGAALNRTIPLLEVTGYLVDTEFWEETSLGKTSPECSGLRPECSGLPVF